MGYASKPVSRHTYFLMALIIATKFPFATLLGGGGSNNTVRATYIKVATLLGIFPGPQVGVAGGKGPLLCLVTCVPNR